MSEQIEKFEMLKKLYHFSQIGYVLSDIFSMNSSLRDLNREYRRLYKQKLQKNHDQFKKQLLAVLEIFAFEYENK